MNGMQQAERWNEQKEQQKMGVLAKDAKHKNSGIFIYCPVFNNNYLFLTDSTTPCQPDGIPVVRSFRNNDFELLYLGIPLKA